MNPLEQPVLAAFPYRLRPFSTDDVAVIQEVSEDPLIPLITTVPASGSKTAALAFIQRQHQRLADRSGYSFAIADATSDQAVGQIGLWLKNLSQGRASIGYWVAPSQRGKGVASTALKALSTWGLAQSGIHRLELYVEPWNEGSWRAAEHAGFIREGTLRSWLEIDGQRRDMYMYSCLP
ncbi:GNAT family protein [Arthrobacter oryzae]|uniref:GNAT family N-acetyltransferase n=1 Tax=Arthrobacter oryzae TaxID=409290 RepID=UPI00285B39A1|nr:GNAT family protein [Arthrobacter oryzae]MDR6508121.1 RimJ/RimL family protein N-acetyltransferase [Arthrobacter oryzae]